VSVETEVIPAEGASQLSAMFDGELSSAECELLARRLGRDEQLRGRWARYALIGAALRSEPVAAVSGDFSRRVGAAIDHGGDAAVGRAGRRRPIAGLRRVAMGGALVAGVAGMGIFVLRSQLLLGDAASVAAARPTPPAQTLVMSAAAAANPEAQLARINAASNSVVREPLSYVVPPSGGGVATALPATLANYVVAHSEYSSPLVRNGLLSSLVSGESAGNTTTAPADGEIVLSGNDSR
jgi:hypothetical protein